MTLDTPKIPELVVLKSEVLLGIPEEHLYGPPLGVCLNDSRSLPPNLVSGKVSGRARKFLIVVADEHSYLADPFEIHCLGEDLIDPIPYLNPPERFSGQSFGEIADCHVCSLDLDVAARLESGYPMQAPCSKVFDELLGSKPIIEENTLDFESTLQSIFNQFLGQLDFRFEGNSLLDRKSVV